MTAFYSFSPIFPIIGFIINVLLQIFAVRMKISEWHLPLMIKSFTLGFLILLILHILNVPILDHSITDIIGLFMVNIIIYFMLCYLFISVIGSGVSSLRMAILFEIKNHPNGLKINELLKIYNAEIILKSRLDRLTGSEHLVLKKNHYFVNNNNIFYIYKIIVFLRYIIFGKINLIEIQNKFSFKSKMLKGYKNND